MSGKRKSTPKKHTALPKVAPTRSTVRKSVVNPSSTTVEPTPVTASVSIIEAAPLPEPVSTICAEVVESPVAELTVATDTTISPVIEKETVSIDLLSLIAGLNGPTAESAADAATALGEAGVEAIDALSDVVMNESGYFHSVVRAAAAASLGKIADPRAIPALIAGVRDSMAEASAESVRALVTIGGAEAVSALVAVVRNADGYYLPVVRLAAVTGLQKLGGPEATSALDAIASNDGEEAAIRQALAS